jgi:hypothetical protein
LDSFAAWPLALVSGADGQIVGFLMPLAPVDFFSTITVDGVGLGRQANEAQQLIPAAAGRTALGYTVPKDDDVLTRLSLAAGIARAFAFLHRRQVVYGDLSGKNLLFSTSPHPRVLLIDCDSVRLSGEATLAAQMNTPFWAAPEASISSRTQTPESDVFKLSLMILRTVVPGDHKSSQTRDAGRVRGVLDPTGFELMRRGLSRDASARPTAAEWYAYLHEVLANMTSSPAIDAVTLEENHIFPGQDVRVRVAVRGAERVRLLAPGGESIDLAADEDTAQLRIWENGVVRVEATNSYGSSVAYSGRIHVLELPRIRHIPFSTPELPALQGSDFARLDHGLHAAGVHLQHHPLRKAREAMESQVPPWSSLGSVQDEAVPLLTSLVPPSSLTTVLTAPRIMSPPPILTPPPRISPARRTTP